MKGGRRKPVPHTITLVVWRLSRGLWPENRHVILRTVQVETLTGLNHLDLQWELDPTGRLEDVFRRFGRPHWWLVSLSLTFVSSKGLLFVITGIPREQKVMKKEVKKRVYEYVMKIFIFQNFKQTKSDRGITVISLGQIVRRKLHSLQAETLGYLGPMV